MAEAMFRPADEYPHPAPEGEESWSFEFVAAGGRLAGYARLTLRPAERTAWWWTAIVGEDRPYVLVKEHEIEPPKRPSLEIRAAGLWAEPYCEAPFEHWSVGLEAFAVALDDPLEAYRGERGDPIPLGLDLGWEAEGEPQPDGESATAYRQPCVVHGAVLVGRERLAVAGTGSWAHAWGPPVWRNDASAVDADGLVAAPYPLYHAPLQLPTGRLARALTRQLAWVERFQPA